jgi:hypothetical protein
MELKLKQNNPTNSSDAEEIEKLTEKLSQELIDVPTVIIENCYQILMRLKKDEPLYPSVEEIKGTAEHALYLNNKLLSLKRDNYGARTNASPKK